MDLRTLENVYPLTRRQEAFLLDGGYAPDAKELSERWGCVLRGPLSDATFVAAWEKVCERVERPLQVVQRQVRLPLKQYDWHGMTAARQFAEFATLLRKEDEQGFN